MKIHVLKKQDLAKVLTMKETIEAMRHCFLELNENLVDMPLRTVIKIPEKNAVSLFMPAFLSKENNLGIKIVSSFPMNKNLQLPNITGAVLLMNSQTGEPKALCDAGYLTAIRTGAVSGLATNMFATSDATTLAIIGSGVQARTQVDAVLSVRDIKNIFIFSRTKNNALKFASEVKKNYPSLNINVTDNVEEASENADIICTATNAIEPFLNIHYLKKTCHINAIGSHSAEMQEIDLSVISKAKIIVDQRSAAIAEAGEIINALQKDIIQPSDLIELGSLINQPKEQSNLKKTLTVFKSVGLAIQDISAAEIALRLAVQHNVGTIIDF